MDKTTEKIFRQWLKNERKAIQETYGRTQDPFARGLRAELTAVETAFAAALKGELARNG